MRYLTFLKLRYYLMLGLFALSTPGVGWTTDWEERQVFEGRSGTETLRVISTTDISAFAPIIEAFLTENPNYNIEYMVIGSAAVYQRFKDAPNDYDVVISSAMDLQLKLVNDGLAYKADDVEHHDWAQWRQSLFGFTLESASIVASKTAFSDIAVPRSRQDMIEVLRANPHRFTGKIGTYDIRESGLGYLFATQDARASETYWRLMEIMGSQDVHLYCCSGSMIEDVASGKIAIAYNVLGSYANARHDILDKLEVIVPADFPNTMMRTVLVAKDTPRLSAAGAFLQYLVSGRWSLVEGATSSLPSIGKSLSEAQRSIITLEPGLMVYLDRLKRESFIKEWESAIIQ